MDFAFNRDDVEKLLGTGDTSYLVSAFSWANTPQGYAYWDPIYTSGVLTDEARAYLQGFLDEDQTPIKEEVKDKYVFAYVSLDGEGNLQFARTDRRGVILGGFTRERLRSCDLVESFKFKVDHYWNTNFTLRGTHDVEEGSFLSAVEVLEDGSYKVVGELDPVKKAFGFKNVEHYYTLMLKLFNGDLGISDPWLWNQRSDIEAVAERSGANVDLRVATNATLFFRPEFTEDGVTAFLNVKDFERGRRSPTTAGRFFRKIMPQLTDAELEKAVDHYNKQFKKRDFTLVRGKDRKDFAHAYNSKQAEMLNPRTSCSRKSLANSCMRNMYIEGMSPAEVFASGDFEILWLEDDKGRIGGRVVVYLNEGGEPQAGPVYGVCEHSLDMLEQALKEMGAVDFDNANWSGARLLHISVYGDDILMPYCDMAEEGWDDGDFIHIDHRNSDVNLQSTEGYVSHGSRISCEECGDPVHEDELYTNDEGYCYCEHCYYELHSRCDITGEEVPSSDIGEVYTSQSRHYWRATIDNPGMITVGPSVDWTDCYYTGEDWLLEDMVEDVDGHSVSPRYAQNNLTEANGVWYTKEQLAENGLDEDGEPIAELEEEEQKGEAA